MIVPRGHPAVFSDAADGDGRTDPAARRRISEHLGISEEWAFVRQVHGEEVIRAEAAGELGEADGIVTTVAGLPIAVTTADCFPVVLSGPGGVGIAHAGWRGAAAGVVKSVRRGLEACGVPVARAAIGPGIGPCCFEVGPEVVERFPGHVAETTWRTVSVDLPGVISAQLAGLEVWSSGICTHHEETHHSFRRDGTERRQAAVAWLSEA